MIDITAILRFTEEIERLNWLGIETETNFGVVSLLSTKLEIFISMYFVNDCRKVGRPDDRVIDVSGFLVRYKVLG